MPKISIEKGLVGLRRVRVKTLRTRSHDELFGRNFAVVIVEFDDSRIW
jgi:hypothetical protein